MAAGLDWGFFVCSWGVVGATHGIGRVWGYGFVGLFLGFSLALQYEALLLLWLFFDHLSQLPKRIREPFPKMYPSATASDIW